MKECLYCKSTFLNKTERVKFCSDKCRVYFNRGNKQKNKEINSGNVLLVEKLDKILDALEKMKLQPIIVEQEKEVKKSGSYFGSHNYSNITVTKPIKTAAEYSQAKLDCENEDQWRELVEEINNAPNLTDREKKILTTF